ncbi:ABC transporter ATP-binding protein [Natronoglycomyces albus]|uniref:ABC transporter ATP-binding protein n=1 Tax=Natronoglycomyces albus TaxID=2811108 RepID=A0A895XWT2_9ACTN|nr:ABC transporter ATP-binding protein [Natronoglycomyces albus]QSB06680.1 ABC transporter ATP-binding protein [Natronoglycomyces albus]
MIIACYRILDRPHRQRFALAIGALITASVLEVAVIVSLFPLLDALIAGEPLAQHLAFTVGTCLVWALFVTIATVAGRRCGYGMSAALHQRLATHLLALPLAWFTARRRGEVTRLMGSGVMDVMSYPSQLVLSHLRALATPALFVVALAWFDPIVAAVALAWLPVLLWCQRHSSRRVTQTDARLAEARVEAANRVIEFAQMQRELRLLPDQAAADALVDRSLTDLRDRVDAMTVAVLPAMSAFAIAVQLTLVSLISVVIVRHEGASAEAIAATCVMLLLVCGLAASSKGAAELDAVIRLSRGSLERITSLLDTPPLPEPIVPTQRDPSRGAGRIEVRQVSASHADGTPVLHEVDFVAEPGTVTAVVGASGSGKTTLLRLLARFMDPDQGAVLLDGVDLRELGSAKVFASTSMVFQDVQLFTGTLADNIRLGNPAPSEAQLEQAVRLSGVDQIAQGLPEGLDTVVGEGGVGLSGGERQRVAIARAVLKDAPILLLDEATASLDAHRQRSVGQAIRQLSADRTVIMVAHLLHTVVEADHILVMDQGRVLERGNHAQLLAREGHYARMWGAQAPLSDSAEAP